MANDQYHQMRGKVFPVWGRRSPHPALRSPVPPGTWGPTVQWGCQGVVPGSRVGGGVGDADLAARPLPQLCRAEYASVTAGRMPGVTDQDLRRLEAWLGNHRHHMGIIRAVVAGPPLQAHRCGCGRGGHLARPRHGTRGRMVQGPR
jgi:hypothetical protein